MYSSDTTVFAGRLCCCSGIRCRTGELRQNFVDQELRLSAIECLLNRVVKLVAPRTPFTPSVQSTSVQRGLRMTSRLPCTSQHALKPINTHRLRLCTPFRATKANSLSGRASLRRHHQSPAAKLARPVSAPANAPVRLPASPPRQVSLLQPNTPIPEQDPHSNGRGKRVVVVGGGWAGKTPASCTSTATLRVCTPAVHSSLLPMQTLRSASQTQMYRMFTVLSSLPAVHAKP